MLGFLRHADWKELAKESRTPVEVETAGRWETLARELDSALKIRSRYETLLDDVDTDIDDRIGERYKAASRNVKRLQEAYSALEAEISADRNASDLLAETNGPNIVRIDTTTVEGRTKLRLFLAQRIERIDLIFGARYFPLRILTRLSPGFAKGEGERPRRYFSRTEQSG
jgi:hypothetical protein